MSSVFLLGHTGSINRGCEAIVRSTIKLLNDTGIHDIYLISYESTYDSRLGVDKLCYYLSYNIMHPLSPVRLLSGGIKKIFKTSIPLEKARLKPLLKMIKKDDIVLTIGGDTFCYGKPTYLYAQHKLLKSMGAKTILWSCSIENDLIDNTMLKDLNSYDYIMPREQISYTTLLEHGIDKEKLIKMSDSAFNLETKEVKKYGDLTNTVGVNVSPIVVQNEHAYEAVIKMIEHIIYDIKMDVLLIPHVYDTDVQDDVINKRIIKDVNEPKRLQVVKEFYSCEELKYIISRCRFFVGARTHATIAAYSSGVPTLVLGYSVKSRGIACDLFDTDEGYAIMYDTVRDTDILIKAFDNIVSSEMRIKDIYRSKMDSYKQSGVAAAEVIKALYEVRKKQDQVYYSDLSCCGCGVCAGRCPVGCIEMRADEYGFKYPVIDMDKCIQCNICRNICPVKNKPETNGIRNVYAAYSTDKKLRANSSSGGIFGTLARKVIAGGGVVFGAAFDKNFKVVHGCVDNIENLPKLYGSKYVQSDLKNTFSIAKQYLDSGILVMFSGTPCQIAGLRKYLGRNYNNLITLDFICHGVPAPMAWEKYKEKRSAGMDITDVGFRDKSEGWKVFSMRIKFGDGRMYRKSLTDDTYMKSFLTDSTLREACTSCAFKGLEGVSDITLADFWGIENYIDKREYVTDKGVSAVIIRTGKGAQLFSECDEIDMEEMDIDKVIDSNPSLIKSVKNNPIRYKILNELQTNDYDEVITKYYGNGVIPKIRRAVLKILM